MWSTVAVCLICILSGITSNAHKTHAGHKIIQRQSSLKTDGFDQQQQEDIQKVIDHIYSLPDGSLRNFNISTTSGQADLNAYFNILRELYLLFSPVSEKFMENFPKTFVCVLSGDQDCGLEAELIKTVSLRLGPPLLSFLSSLRSQTCAPASSDEEMGVLFKTYLRMGDTTLGLSIFQQTFVNMLSSFSVSESLNSVINGLLDTTTSYLLQLLATVLEVPMDYILIALQFGIEVPSLEEKLTCQQGDLKQLIIWGMKHNLSWSLGTPLVDILLENFLPVDKSAYPYQGAECQSPLSVELQRRTVDTTNDTQLTYEITCDDHSLAALNETQCADVLAGTGNESSASVLTLCQALSSLSHSQVQQLWSNSCNFLQALASPFSSRSLDCNAQDALPFVLPLIESPTVSSTAPLRVARDVRSIQQSPCSYSSWLNSSSVNATRVFLCSTSERTEFVKQVCGNATLMRKLLTDPANSWLYGYCANSSADAGYLVSHFCDYDLWLDQPTGPVDPGLLGFCMSLDTLKLTRLICDHMGFLMFLLSNPGNWDLVPNCTNSLAPPPFPDQDSVGLDSCRYSEWHDLQQITTDVLSHCILHDLSGFSSAVCSNKTFLSRLLQDSRNAWLDDQCSTLIVPTSPQPSPEPSAAFNMAAWCDYQNWGERQVDDSIVGLCWQHDEASFHENVCCKAAVLEKLLQNPQNKWLSSACSDMEEVTVSPEVCTYSEWSRPIIVDMTEVALCSEIDPLNFTSKVCANSTILQNLLANQDNTWLIQHCGNRSAPTSSPGGSVTLFNTAKQCQYSSWSISPPDTVLLTLCWEHDQANFISSVCPSSGILLSLSWVPSSVWVTNMCKTFTNLTTPPTNNSATDNTACVDPDLLKQLNSICPKHAICQPCATQNMVLQAMVRCFVDHLKSKADLVNGSVAAVLDRVVGTSVVILLAVEDVLGASWQVTSAIRSGVLQSVIDYFETKDNPDIRRVMLQCFGTVLSNLLQVTRDVTSDKLLLIKEYFNLPLSNLKQVLSAANINTVRLILQYYSGVKSTLKLPDGYLSTMVSVFLQTHLVKDTTLFPELAPLLAAATPADIRALPSLQNNVNVKDTINRILSGMSLEQRDAFGLWYSRVMSRSNITKAQQSFIRDSGNLIAYLPFEDFQHLSAAQLLDGLDVLQKNTLSPLKQEFIASKLTGTYRNLTAQDFIRLGNISCLAEPAHLLVYNNSEAFKVIQANIMNCTLKGVRMSSQLVSTVLLSSPELQVPSSLSSERLAEVAPLLPLLGVTFLQRLTAAQLLTALPALGAVSFSPVQASVVVEKLLSSTTLTTDQLQGLGSLAVGVKTETLLTFTSDKLLLFLKNFGRRTQDQFYKVDQCSPQGNFIATKLWGFPEVVNWLDDMEVMLSCTPLRSVLARTRPLMAKLPVVTTKQWNTQQAKAIFTELLNSSPNELKKYLPTLGTLGQGVVCRILQELLPSNLSPSSVRIIISFLRQRPVLLHNSLKKCLIEELMKFEFFSELLLDLGSDITLSIPMITFNKFTVDAINNLRKIINQDPRSFLMMSRTQQGLLVDKIAQKLEMYTGVFTEDEFRSLGILAPFVVDEVFVQLDRRYFSGNLAALKELCYTGSKMEIMARILQEPAVFGPMQTWNQTTLTLIGRLIFFLPTDALKMIPLELMPVGRIEKLFMSHQLWEAGNVGMLCSDQSDKKSIFEKQQFVLQFFLGFLMINPLSSTPLVPSCEILHTIAPSAWTSSSLTSMSTAAFSNCLELMGRDSFLAKFQRAELLKKVKKVYGPVSSLSQLEIVQLGLIATELAPEELSMLRLTERRSISAMGSIKIWTDKQLAALFAAVLNSTKQTPSQLDSSTLVALGHIICGAKTTEIKSFNNVEFSKAVLCLGQLRLTCSEEQLQALVGLLTNSLAFGHMSTWGTDVFIETGVLAAGVSDFDMSSLVKEQIEGITPAAISMIAPQKFAVAFHQNQISMFSYEQAAAVTPQQFSALSDVQKTALDIVLSGPPNKKGVKSLGSERNYHPVCLIFGLIVQLCVLFGRTNT